MNRLRGESMKNKLWIMMIILFSCVLMGYVDAIIQPEYFIKSAIKVVLFLTLPLIYFILYKDKMIKTLFSISKKALKTAFTLGISLYVFIVVGYLLLQNVIDFSQITGALSSNIGVNASNFIFVAIYISIINSLLEEFFFRGFSFITLKQYSSRTFAYFFSALAFALYHVAMMIGWFSIPIFLLMIIGLMIGGILFNFLNEKYNSIYVSWIVHLFANLGINTVGLILFGII